MQTPAIAPWQIAQPPTGGVSERARAIDPASLSADTIMAWTASYLWRHRGDPALRRIQNAFLGDVPLSRFSDPARFAGDRLLGEERFRHARQRPDTFYIPDLEPIAFPASDQVARHLEAHAEVFAEEFAAVAGSSITSPSQGLATQGGWGTFPLMRGGRPIPANIARCPRSWEALSDLPLLMGASGAAYFSILPGGTRIAPHFGPSNMRWRYHLAIEDCPGARIRVAEEWQSWSRNRCLILDDSFEHEVVHDGERRRVVLLVDAWRPELTDAERAFIVGLYRCMRTRQTMAGPQG